ncbi:MAG: P22 phage major capsid protein family protein, partial [Terriglobia bacterium]
MPAITSANVAQAIVKLVAAQALPALMGNLVMGRLVNRDYEPTLAQAGDTVNVPIPPTMTANNIAEAGTVTTQSPSLGNAQIVLNSHKEATFQIPDVTKVLAVPDLVKTYMNPAIIALATAIDTDLLSYYPLFTANTAVGTGSTVMDEVRIDLAETELFKSYVPSADQKFLVVSPGSFSAMRQVSRFTDYQTVGPTGQPASAVTGQLAGAGPLGANGKIKDFLVFRSQFVPVASGIYYNFAFAKDALG